MTAPERNEETAAAALAPEAPFFTDNDPALFGKALAAAANAAAKHPWTGASLAMQLGAKLVGTGIAAGSRLWGTPAAGPMPVDPRDKRFADPAWEDNPAFWALRQGYLA